MSELRVAGQLTQIRALLAKQNELLEHLVEATHARKTGAVSQVQHSEETIKERHDVGWTYELHVPEEPPLRTIVIDREGSTWERHKDMWHSSRPARADVWINLLKGYGPVAVIHRPESPNEA